MNILILGYGKMGKTIEGILKERNHRVTAIDSDEERDNISPGAFDAAIEFSQPDAAFNNIVFCLKNNIPVVSGTTGWLHKLDEVKSLCTENKGTFFYSSNYSIGVNIFFKLNKWLAEKMNRFDEYEPSIKEIHHTQKLDSPSGTAITLAEGIVENIDRFKKWKEDENGEGIVEINAEREDDVPGTHIITYKSTIDNITIEHKANSRKGFALGAVLVAEWIKDKKGNLKMDDFLDI